MNIIYKTIVLIIILTSIFIQLNAQAIISGQIKTAINKDPLIYCSVGIYSSQDSLIAGTITNEKGFFKVQLKDGSYKLISKYIGYLSDTTNIVVGGEDQFLGTIRMGVDHSEIGEVLVSGSLSKSDIDKEVQLVTKHMRTGSANTSDLLERVRGVAYDRYNNSIKVDGDDNIIVLVNGLEKNQQYIRNISPEKLKEIEVIRSPGGRYALDGYSAIINVVLKNDYRGSEIYVENTAMIDLDTKEQNYLPINDFSLTYNYSYDKLNFYARASNNYSAISASAKTLKEYPDGSIIETRSIGQRSNLETDFLSSNYTVGLDYYINPKQTFSYESNIGAFPSSRRIIKHSYNVSLYFNGVATDNYLSEIVNSSRTPDLSNSLFYVYKINSKTQINADFTHLRYREDYSNSIVQSNGIERYEDGKNKKDYTKFYLELNHDFREGSSFMAGYGNTWRQINNDYVSESLQIPSVNILNDTSSFSLTEVRHKLYAYYSSRLSNKLKLKIGGAAEYSHPKSGELDNKYIIYQPHLDLDFSAHQSLQFKLKYRAANDYPSIKQVTPFSHMIDSYITEIGNPDLEPEQTHTVSLRLRILNGLLSLEPYYSFSNNKINRIACSVNDNVLTYSYANVGNYRSQGVKGDLTVPLFKHSIIFQTSFDVFKSSIVYKERINDVNDWVMNTQLLYINKKYSTVGGLNYQKGIKKLINAQGYEYYNTDYWMLFVQQPLLKNNMTVMLGYMLPIDFGVLYEQGSYIETDLYKATAIYDISMLKNMLTVKLSYRFNSGNDIRSIDKNIKKEIEKKSKGLF